MKGLEPPRPETLDPMSNAATNYATCAFLFPCKGKTNSPTFQNKNSSPYATRDYYHKIPPEARVSVTYINQQILSLRYRRTNGLSSRQPVYSFNLKSNTMKTQCKYSNFYLYNPQVRFWFNSWAYLTLINISENPLSVAHTRMLYSANFWKVEIIGTVTFNIH